MNIRHYISIKEICVIIPLFFTLNLFSQSPMNGIDIIIESPKAVKASDGTVLGYYELKIANYGFKAVKLSKIHRIVEGAAMDTLSGDDVKGYAVGTYDSYSSNILPGGTIIVFINAPLAVGICGSDIEHEVEYRYLTDKGAESESVTIIAPIDCIGSSFISPPLKNGEWIAIYSPIWERGHRRVINATGGKARISGRYAIDFVKVDTEGKYYNGDSDTVENYYSYGEKVYSGSSGTVVDLRNDFVEYKRISQYKRPGSIDEAGNYLVIKLDNGTYLHYEHLKPQSIKVKVGEKVVEGQEVARVGFTGSNSNPHLHVHLSDGPKALTSEGVPFGLKNYESIGKYGLNGKNLGLKKWLETETGVKNDSRPVPNEVVRFD